MTSQKAPLERFGDVVKDRRKQRGWSQDQLAEAADVSRPTVARIEAGAEVSTGTLSRIATALGLEVHIELPSD